MSRKQKYDRRRQSSERSLTRERDTIIDNRLRNQTNQKILKDQEFLNTAIAEFLGDLIQLKKEDQEKLIALVNLIGNPVKVLEKGDPKVRELALDPYDTPKEGRGQPVVKEGEKRQRRVVVSASSLKLLRQMQHDINKILAKLLGYKDVSEMKVFFNFNFFAQTINS